MAATQISLVFIMYKTSQIYPWFYNPNSSVFSVPMLAYGLNFRALLLNIDAEASSLHPPTSFLHIITVAGQGLVPVRHHMTDSDSKET